MGDYGGWALANGDIGLQVILREWAEIILLPSIQVVLSKRHSRQKMIDKFISSFINFGGSIKIVITGVGNYQICRNKILKWLWNNLKIRQNNQKKWNEELFIKSVFNCTSIYYAIIKIIHFLDKIRWLIGYLIKYFFVDFN